MRRAAPAIVAVVLLAGCGSGEKKPATTATQPAKPRTTPRTVPGGTHPNRPQGSVYPDEIGENIVTVPRDRVIKRFGPPASTKANCVRYRIVKQPHQQWQFCFKGQKMTSAGVVPVP